MKLKHIITNATLALGFSLTTLAQDKVDPYASKGAIVSNKVDKRQSGKASPTHAVIFEAFSLTMKEAAALLRSDMPEAQLYKHMTEKAKQEVLMVVRAPFGQKSTAESIIELIYPTEYEPPLGPVSLGVQIVPEKRDKDEDKDKDKESNTSVIQTEKLSKAPKMSALNGLIAPALATAFETRNTGMTLQVELVENKDGTINMKISPEFVYHIGSKTYGQGLSETEMPLFDTQRINISATVTENKPLLTGTMNRSPISKLDVDPANSVWFSFATVKRLK